MSRSLLARLFLAAVLLGGLVACHGQLAAETSPASPGVAPPVADPAAAVPPAGPAVPPGVAAQIQRGAPIFARACSQCHGVGGEGTAAAPALIGAHALPVNPPPRARTRRSAFRSAKDVGMFIMTTMPPQGPRLPPTDVAAVLAWLLRANGASPTQPVSPATAGSMPIHR